MIATRSHRWLSLALLLGLMVSTFALPTAPRALANHSATPTSVNLAGSLEAEASGNACNDWTPECPASAFTAQGNGVYLYNSATIPADSYAYKVAINGSWTENYGANFQQDGPNIDLNLPAARTVRFYYDHKTHYIADNVRNTIYTVPGSFNDLVGCGGNWQPACLATLLSDVNGDGIYSTVVSISQPGSYEFKVATNESWDNPNYGLPGSGNNVPFSVSGPSIVTFSFNSATNVPSVSVQSTVASPDNNVEWNGLRHDSRDTLYRTPGGAVPAGTAVTIRFRSLHNDLTAVTLRVYDVNTGGQRFIPMQPAASAVSCYQAELADQSCDFWAATLDEADPNNLWYRFIVADGSDTDYYADNTAALDGGLGTVSDEPVDSSYALMFHKPGFSAPNWARSTVIYQIFPDRFRNGRSNNDPKTGDVRYDDPVVKLGWNELPEGYCRNYSDANTNCPWRFDTTPPDWSPLREGPRGRDYHGGDLRGVDQQLAYIQALGIKTIYFNPIFDAGSNHSYDTQDYYTIDPYFGTQKDWENLVKHANERGIRIILDSVFNHMSSDSAFFDRYSHYSAAGACESASSPYRGWFNFRTPAGVEPNACVPSAPGSTDTYYAGWFGFDSIPELKKSNPSVLDYFVTATNSVSRYWLKQGAAGWRLDVMGDASFPQGYWEDFRQVTRATRSDSLIIGELWQKDSTLLRHLRGQTADTTMNYRQRDAIIGLLTPGAFDSKGFGDSGRIIEPSEFAARLASIREDYPDAAYYSLMNLLGSHDTERILWTLTPGAETRASKEFDAANLAEGKRRLQIASLIQFTTPGAPTVYYGDEVGVTGDDDPDDRRTYPWADRGGNPDQEMLAHYRELAKQRNDYATLTQGDLRMLLADDAADTVAYGRRHANEAALVAINRSTQARTLDIPVAGYFPDGTRLQVTYQVGNENIELLHVVEDGHLRVALAPLSAALLLSDQADLTAPGAPAGLSVSDEGDGEVSLAWGATPGATGYNLYRSPLSGGGWVKLNGAPIAGTSYTDSSVTNGQLYYYVVRALDAAGNESQASGEVSALPHYTIGWANLQWPPSINHTISTTNRTPNVYGQVYIADVTSQSGATPGLRAQLGYGPDGSNPATSSAWLWQEATFNANAGNNDEFQASLLPEAVGEYDYTYRYSSTNGRDWFYAIGGPNNSNNPIGALTVVSSGDASAPAVPSGLSVVSASPAGIALEWDAVAGDASLYGYEVARSSSAGGTASVIARVTGTSYTDTSVAQGVTYFYSVRSLDSSFNRSAYSSPVEATAELRTVSVTFNVTVPSSTDATGRVVHIAGRLDLLDGNLPQWDPAGVELTRVNATTWSITLTGKEGTQLPYKYTLGAWDYVEKGVAQGDQCPEIADRLLTLTYGANGTQQVNSTIDNWRNVAPCGN